MDNIKKVQNSGKMSEASKVVSDRDRARLQLKENVIELAAARGQEDGVIDKLIAKVNEVFNALVDSHVEMVLSLGENLSDEIHENFMYEASDERDEAVEGAEEEKEKAKKIAREEIIAEESFEVDKLGLTGSKDRKEFIDRKLMISCKVSQEVAREGLFQMFSVGSISKVLLLVATLQGEFGPQEISRIFVHVDGRFKLEQLVAEMSKAEEPDGLKLFMESVYTKKRNAIGHEYSKKYEVHGYDIGDAVVKSIIKFKQFGVAGGDVNNLKRSRIVTGEYEPGAVERKWKSHDGDEVAEDMDWLKMNQQVKNVVNNGGTIAKPSTRAFMEVLSAGEDISMVDQFGQLSQSMNRGYRSQYSEGVEYFSDSVNTLSILLKCNGRLEGIKKHCSILLDLGKVSMGNKNYVQAMEKLTSCLEKGKDKLSDDAREIAQSECQRGVALGYHGQRDEGVKYCSGSVNMRNNTKMAVRRKFERPTGKDSYNSVDHLLDDEKYLLVQDFPGNADSLAQAYQFLAAKYSFMFPDRAAHHVTEAQYQLKVALTYHDLFDPGGIGICKRRGPSKYLSLGRERDETSRFSVSYFSNGIRRRGSA